MGVKLSQVMVPNFTPTLLLSVTCAIFVVVVPFCGPLATCFSLLCGGFVSSAANILQATLIAALRLLGVSIALICLRCSLVLPLPASISMNQLFPLGLLLGFSGGSLLAGSLCVLDPIVHFGVLFLVFLSAI